MLGRPRSFCADQLELERGFDPGRDLVLQGKQVARVGP